MFSTKNIMATNHLKKMKDNNTTITVGEHDAVVHITHDSIDFLPPLACRMEKEKFSELSDEQREDLMMKAVENNRHLKIYHEIHELVKYIMDQSEKQAEGQFATVEDEFADGKE